MSKHTLRAGIASIVAATVIGVGLTAPTVSAAPVVKTYSTVDTFTINQDVMKEMNDRFGFDFSKLFQNITIDWPGVQPVKPAPTQPVKPAPTQPVKPAPTQPVKPEPTQPVKPAPTQPVKPAPTQPVKPAPTQPVKPAPTQPVKPAPTQPAQPKPDTGSDNLGTFQSQVIELVNQERAKAGLSPVKYDALLTKVATEKARDMDVNNYFSHTSPTYGSPFDMMRSFGVQYSYAGENIASGQRTPQEVMNGWMNSPGHRANILSQNFTKIGVGYVNGEWVQMFIG